MTSHDHFRIARRNLPSHPPSTHTPSLQPRPLSTLLPSPPPLPLLHPPFSPPPPFLVKTILFPPSPNQIWVRDYSSTLLLIFFFSRRLLIVRKKPTLLKLSCGVIVVVGLFICLIPTIFPKVDPKAEKTKDNAQGVSRVMWPIMFMLGFVSRTQRQK